MSGTQCSQSTNHISCSSKMCMLCFVPARRIGKLVHSGGACVGCKIGESTIKIGESTIIVPLFQTAALHTRHLIFFARGLRGVECGATRLCCSSLAVILMSGPRVSN